MKKPKDPSTYIMIVGGFAALLLLIYILRNQSYFDRILQLFVVVFTFFTAFSAYQSSKASEKSTRATFLPIIKLEVDEITKDKFRLTLKNIGSQLAQEIVIKVQRAYPDIKERVPYYQTIPTLEIEQVTSEYLMYTPHELSSFPYVIVLYKDIFGGTVKTVGKFTLKRDEKGIPDEIAGIVWEFTLQY